MARKTVTLSEDAHERLRAARREGESFSDVVRRLTGGGHFSEYHGALSEETADDLEEAIAERRRRRNDTPTE